MRIRESVPAKIVLVFLGALIAAAAIFLITSPKAQADPLLKCGSAPFVGSWCDKEWQPDGSYIHCLSSWGQLDCSWVCTLAGNPVNPPLAPNGPGSCGQLSSGFGPARY